MLAEDEDALICDFAETYHIYDIWGLEITYLATLAAGLRADSRIMKKMSGEKEFSTAQILAMIADNTRISCWLQSTDGANGKNYPPSILEMITKETEQADQGFDSPEDYEETRRRILRRAGYG